MKKIFSLAIMAMLTFSVASCDRSNDNVQVENTDTYSTAYDITNQSFVKGTNGAYTISRNFNNPLVESDVVLIFRKTGTTNSSNPVWQSIPRTFFTTQGELDYDYDFSKTDILIKIIATYDPALTPEYLSNQTFRIVVVPAKTGKNANVDLTNYDSVIKFYNVKESNIRNL